MGHPVALNFLAARLGNTFQRKALQTATIFVHPAPLAHSTVAAVAAGKLEANATANRLLILRLAPIAHCAEVIIIT